MPVAHSHAVDTSWVWPVRVEWRTVPLVRCTRIQPRASHTAMNRWAEARLEALQCGEDVWGNHLGNTPYQPSFPHYRHHSTHTHTLQLEALQG